MHCNRVLVVLALAVIVAGEASWFGWSGNTAPSVRERMAANTLAPPAAAHTEPSAEWLESIRQQSHEELSFLEQGKRSLQKYESDSKDCYKDAATSLHAGCKELTVLEAEKVQYAIRLTLCEVATANMNVPAPCSWNEPGTACVEALAQVPQLWTSYSGYFREVMSMCYAVRHQIEREMVEALFYNLTLAQLVNSNSLNQHAMEMANLHEREMHAVETVVNSQAQLRAQTVELAETLHRLSTNISSSGQNVADMQHDLGQLAQVQLAMRGSASEWMAESAGQVQQALQMVQALSQEVSALAAKLGQEHSLALVETAELRSTIAEMSMLAREQKDGVANSFHEIGDMVARARQEAHQQLAAVQSLGQAIYASAQEHLKQLAASQALSEHMATSSAENARLLAETERLLMGKQQEQQEHIQQVSLALADIQMQAQQVHEYIGSATAIVRWIVGERAQFALTCAAVLLLLRLVGAQEVAIVMLAALAYHGRHLLMQLPLHAMHPSSTVTVLVVAFGSGGVALLAWICRRARSTVLDHPNNMADSSNRTLPTLEFPFAIRTLARSKSKSTEDLPPTWRRYRPRSAVPALSSTTSLASAED
ncbi:hypothetical protein BC828DRAFT_376039 [Blastocladiella britannica]|nr:hypothetical protein BC828DRAFT_376039 [Blastocladiella britannica]